jgi:hypothetical protein
MVWGVPFLTPHFLIMGENRMIKFLIGVGFTTLILGGLIFVPYFIDYFRLSNLFFGMNNLFFMFGGFLLGALFHREFFTDEIPEPPKTFKANKRLNVNLPMATRKTFENDSLGGNNVN